MSPIKRNVLPFATFLGLALLPALSHADDYYTPASNVKYEPVIEAHAATCSEATREAWFNRQMELSDGDVSPGIATPAECNRTVVAASGAAEEESAGVYGEFRTEVLAEGDHE